VAGRGRPDADGVCHFTFSRNTLIPDIPARMWLVVDALTDITVHEVSWLTPDVPSEANVKLGLCFATFNRLPYLRRVVNEILSDPSAVACVNRILVVNQGKEFARDELIADENRDTAARIDLLKQDNFGGCGGFTRGIIECLADDDITHILLCDDDIVFEPHSLVRLTSFLRYCRNDVAIGGQMLDILRPNFLYESGAVLRENTLTPRPLGHNGFLGEPEVLDEMINLPSIDYNGWWFFAFSKETARKIALPMPCFIRGDDIEYGVRMKRHGIQTVVLPGLVVWHEPFYLKLGGWHYYYEVKNRFILGVMHYRRSPLRDLNNILWVFMRDILTCRYYTAKLAILAIDDFIKGPAAAMTCDPAKLAEVRELYKVYGPSSMQEEYLPTEACPAAPKWLRLPGLVHLMIGLSFLMSLFPIPGKTLPRCFLPANHFNIVNTALLNKFIVREMDGTTYLHFQRSRRLGWKLLSSFAASYIMALLKFNTVSEKYKTEFNTLTNKSSWKERLNLT